MKIRKKHRIKFEKRKGTEEKWLFGRVGWVAKEGGMLTEKRIKSIDLSIKHSLRELKRGSWKRYWRQSLKSFVTKKGEGSRMGKGVGSFSHKVGYVRPGAIVLEIDIQKEVGFHVWRRIHGKLGFQTEFKSGEWIFNRLR